MRRTQLIMEEHGPVAGESVLLLDGNDIVIAGPIVVEYDPATNKAFVIVDLDAPNFPPAVGWSFVRAPEEDPTDGFHAGRHFQSGYVAKCMQCERLAESSWPAKWVMTSDGFICPACFAAAPEPLEAA